MADGLTPPVPAAPRLFLIAGEPSGDALGAALLAGLRARAPAPAIAGVGGPAMAAEGLQSLFPMADLSVMGLAEVVPRYPALRRRLIQTADAVVAMAPDALVTIDSPDFCLRVAARARRRLPGLRVIHYVAPSVWAWRSGRARTMARVVDHVLALLPFEPPLMTAAGMGCSFVGHPVAATPAAPPAAAAAFRAARGIAPDAPLLLLLPGSRAGEVNRLLPRFRDAADRLRARRPGLRVALPTVPAVEPLVRALTRDWAAAPAIAVTAHDRAAALAAGDLALAASGTISLDLAANGVPMVIGYDLAPLSRWLVGLLLRTDTVTLVNLVAESRTVPEFLGADCTPAALAQALTALLDDPGARAAQQAAMALTMARLGRGGPPPGLRAADAVLSVLAAPPRR